MQLIFWCDNSLVCKCSSFLHALTYLRLVALYVSVYLIISSNTLTSANSQTCAKKWWEPITTTGGSKLKFYFTVPRGKARNISSFDVNTLEKPFSWKGLRWGSNLIIEDESQSNWYVYCSVITNMAISEEFLVRKCLSRPTQRPGTNRMVWTFSLHELFWWHLSIVRWQLSVNRAQLSQINGLWFNPVSGKTRIRLQTRFGFN